MSVYDEQTEALNRIVGHLETIAAKLDTLLAKLDTIQAKQETGNLRLERLLQTVKTARLGE